MAVAVALAVAATPLPPLAWELPYTADAALGGKKSKSKNKNKLTDFQTNLMVTIGETVAGREELRG